MRKLFVVALCGLFFVSAAPVAFGQNPHFVRGPFLEDLGNQLQVTGTIAGLGSEPLKVLVVADAVVHVECRNPGGNVAPGQSQTLNVTGETGEVTPDRRGRFVIGPGALVTEEPAISGAEACPNPQWQAEVTDVEFSNVRIFVEQPIGSEPRQIFP